MKEKDWADERADAVVNSIGYREDPEAAIAAALRQVADECASIINSEAQRLGRLVLDTDDEFDVASAKLLAVVEVLRARFPRCHDAVGQSRWDIAALAETLDAARKQGRIEGLEETVALLRSRAARWRDEFQTMAATAECLADFVQYRIEELQK